MLFALAHATPSRPALSPEKPKAAAAPAAGGGKGYEEWVIGAGPSSSGSAAGAGGPATSSSVTSKPTSSSENTWFAGKLPRAKAEKLLLEAPNGTFLVRESDSRPVGTRAPSAYHRVRWGG